MTDDTIYFSEHVTAPVLRPEEAQLLLDHLDNVQAASLLGPRWDVWVAAKRRLIHIVADGESKA